MTDLIDEIIINVEFLQYPLDLAVVMMLTGQDTFLARPIDNRSKWFASKEEDCR